MIHQQDEITKVVAKSLAGQELSVTEQDMLTVWLTDPSNKRLYNKFLDQEFLRSQLQLRHSMKADEGIQYFNDFIVHERPGKTFRRIVVLRYMAAAVLFSCIGVGLYFFFHKPIAISPMAKTQTHTDFAPAHSGATLILANGQVMRLDNTLEGGIIKQGATEIENRHGALVYKGDVAAEPNMLYNTLSTGKGQVFATTLVDGTRIWLDANSTVRYPVSFGGSLRKIELTGEAFLEVSHDPRKPFVVSVGDMTVQVLGTAFNVCAYQNDPDMKATLVEGSIKISTPRAIRLLRPHDQARLQPDQTISVSHDADIDEALSWKNGVFYFDGVDIDGIARQLERWYNIQVSFEGEKPTTHFGGKVQRDLSLSQVLFVLEKIGLHFRMEGNRLIILK